MFLITHIIHLYVWYIYHKYEMCVDQHTTYVDRVAYAVSLYFHILDHCKDQIHVRMCVQ